MKDNLNHTALSPTYIAAIQEVCKEFNNDEGKLVNILHKIQHVVGYLPETVQKAVADQLNVPFTKVSDVVSFYTFFITKPRESYPISVCVGSACKNNGAAKVLDELQEQLGIAIGEATADGKFSLSCSRCVGACGKAPVLSIAGKFYTSVSPKEVQNILSSYE